MSKTLESILAMYNSQAPKGNGGTAGVKVNEDVGALESATDHMAWNAVHSDKGREKILLDKGYSKDQILKPNDPRNPTKDWAIIDHKQNTIHPMKAKGDVGASLAGAVPMMGKMAAQTVGTLGGAAAGALATIPTMGAINPVTGAILGSAGASGLEELGEQALLKNAGIEDLGLGGSLKEAGKESLIGGVTGALPGITNVAKGGIKAIATRSMKPLVEGAGKWGAAIAGQEVATQGAKIAGKEIEKNASKMSLPEIVAGKFGKPSGKLLNEVENITEASGIDDSLAKHLIERSAEGKTIPVTTTAWKNVPKQVSEEILPKIRASAKGLQKFARTSYNEALEQMPKEVQERAIDATPIHKVIQELSDVNPDIERAIRNTGLDITKKSYTTKELNAIKNKVADLGPSSTYAREAMGTSPMVQDPMTLALNKLDGTIRGTIKENVPEMKALNEMYGEVMDATKETLFRTRKGKAERILKALSDPDWKTERVVAPLQNLEAGIIKYGKQAEGKLGTKIEGFYDDLMDKMVTLKFGNPKQRVKLPMLGMLKDIPVLGEALKHIPLVEPTGRAFARTMGIGARLGAGKIPMIPAVSKPLQNIVGASGLVQGTENLIKPKQDKPISMVPVKYPSSQEQRQNIDLKIKDIIDGKKRGVPEPIVRIANMYDKYYKGLPKREMA